MLVSEYINTITQAIQMLQNIENHSIAEYKINKKAHKLLDYCIEIVNNKRDAAILESPKFLKMFQDVDEFIVDYQMYVSKQHQYMD